jgi:hypothetical protein
MGGKMSKEYAAKKVLKNYKISIFPGHGGG